MTDSARTRSLNTRYAELLAVLDNAADAIISMDNSGRVLTFNPAAERMFQYHSEEIVGSDIRRLMPDPIGGQHNDYVGRYVRTGESKIIGTGRDVQCQRKDGSVFTANLSVSESISDGQLLFTGILRDLTEQHAIRDRVSQLGSILDNSLSAIYVIEPASNTIAYANQTAWQAWGAAPETGRTLTLHELFDADSCDRFLAAMAEFARGAEKSRDFRARAIRHNGVRYTVQVHLFAGRHGRRKVAIASVLDISAQQRVEAQLQLKQLEQQLILRYAPIGIALMNEDGIVLSVNEAASKTCGYDEQQLLGRPALSFMHTDDQITMRRVFARLVNSDINYSSSTHRLRHRDGHYVPVKTYNAVVNDKALGHSTLICMFEDLSAQHAQESELQIQRERLAHASRLTQMGEMAAGLAHELNQPLAAIRTYANASRRMIQDDTPHREEMVQACERISQQAQRAADVIRKIRALTSRHATEYTRCDLNAVIEDLMTLVEIDLRHADIKLRIDLEEGLFARADAVQIEQVLLNFIRNAIDATDGLPDERRGIELHGRYDDDRVLIEVIDRGRGVSDAIKPMLFVPFVSDKPAGIGMGLSISKTIIEAHDGSIGVRDNTPDGAIFWFTLPACAGPGEDDA